MVLVHLGERARPVKFCGGIENLQTAIRSTFRDVLLEDEAELVLQVYIANLHARIVSELLVYHINNHCPGCALQVKDAALDGAYVDIMDQEIENRCQVRVVV